MSKRIVILILTILGAAQAHAFCGFYVAKGDTKIFNRASQVVVVRDQDRTVMTMANDFKGEPNTRPLILDAVTGTIVSGDSDNDSHGHDDKRDN